MNGRVALLGLAAVGTLAWLRKPRDRGAPHDEYFAALNALLKRDGPAHPCLVLDLDRLDRNIETVRRSIRAPKHYRVVSKSLPSLRLIEYVFTRAETRRLMSFHRPFLNAEAEAFPDADILVGKPLPVLAAARFYERVKGRFDPARQLQWLIDTPERMAQYRDLATAKRLQLRVSVELDVGLHRGGVEREDDLVRILRVIAENPDHLELAGFMGYDPHVAKLPRLLGSREALFRASMQRYQAFVDVTRREFPTVWREDLTLNGAGSPTYRLHEHETLCNDLSVGSALVKPTDFDVDTLSGHIPAIFIATPVLKVLEGIRLPGLEWASPAFTTWNPNLETTYFMYGGHWSAHFESPRGLQSNTLYGLSSNQEFVNASPRTALRVDDHIFLRPTQSESVLLQFGDLVVVRGAEIVDTWPVHHESERTS